MSGCRSKLKVCALVILAVAGWVLPASAQQPERRASSVGAAVSRVVPKDVVTTEVEERSRGVLVTGHAKTLDDVAGFMRSLTNLVSTPRGIARVLEKRREPHTVRVELLGVEGDVIVDFAAKDVSSLEVDLQRAERKLIEGTGERIHFVLTVQSK